MFSSGQSVVCVDGDFSVELRKLYHELPVAGVTYTIRDVAPGQSLALEPEVAVTLVELVNPTQGRSSIERAFNGERFAPLDLLPDEVEKARKGDEVFA